DGRIAGNLIQSSVTSDQHRSLKPSARRIIFADVESRSSTAGAAICSKSIHVDRLLVVDRFSLTCYNIPGRCVFSYAHMPFGAL
ncbi:hypothetical protein KC19_8G019100, partial [Ceratodon purpureus]